MKVIIKAIAPTYYQVQSLRAFNIGVAQHGNGSFSGEILCDSMKEAREFLTNRAEMYFDTPQALRSAKQDIRRGCLTLDTVTAYIHPLNNK